MVLPSGSVPFGRETSSNEVARVLNAFMEHRLYSLAKDQYSATVRDCFISLALTVRDQLTARWIAAQQRYYKKDAKRVYYLSAEFLLGRALTNNLINLGLYETAREAMRMAGIDFDEIAEQEFDAGLGNGGLGRLAACFLDSLATLAMPGYGYGIRYEFGMFDQELKNGYQVERPDEWLRFGNPWEVARPEYAVPVHFGGHVEERLDEKKHLRAHWLDTEQVLGVPYDMPIAGYGPTANVNTLRLWRARASSEFDLSYFNNGDYERAVLDKNRSETISKVLYPSDVQVFGKELRLRQQYFFVACALHDILRRHRILHQTFDNFADKVAIQLNDTHPAVAIPELMRLFVDEHDLPWEQAWELTVRTFGYTNHTLLPEALETWPVDLFGRNLPRHLSIILEINRRFLRQVRSRFPHDETRLGRMSLIDEGAPGDPGSRRIRMAYLAVVGSHSVNGVALLHTELLERQLLGDFYEMWPERFNNKTNGVTPRRWLLATNPALAAAISARIGEGWITDLDQLSRLVPLADDATFRAEVRTIKAASKAAFARYVARHFKFTIDPTTLFDVQVKRIHEYKRQLLNLLHIITLYLRIKHQDHEVGNQVVPRTFIFGGKAAPAYVAAKTIIKLINAVADVINEDPQVKDRLRVLFLPNYRVSLAEKIFPAADLSEQISTAGKEASGTGNMKLALNGALTIGTLDGANIEMRNEVGAENFFLFGLTAAEVQALRDQGYRPREYVDRDPELKSVLDLISSGFFSPEQPDLFRPLVQALLDTDPYMLLADFRAYVECQEAVSQAYRDPERWTRMSILNIAKMGRFSSDRTIREYAREIWKVDPVPG
ncbi:MAG TPA: glycogen/starch/alpha-glucan phosphorylase [Polyangia bacterium]|jgi:starch phosphorylase|nr:glycogen/starch/alpha-glucan phosphorylase [Polyangia bacterium]